MSFEEWWIKRSCYFLCREDAAKRIWQASAAEQKKKDAEIARNRKVTPTTIFGEYDDYRQQYNEACEEIATAIEEQL